MSVPERHLSSDSWGRFRHFTGRGVPSSRRTDPKWACLTRVNSFRIMRWGNPKSRPMFTEAGLSLPLYIICIYIYNICIAGLIARRTRLHKYFRLAGNNNIEIKESSEQQIRYPLVSIDHRIIPNYPYENDHVSYKHYFQTHPSGVEKKSWWGDGCNYCN